MELHWNRAPAGNNFCKNWEQFRFEAAEEIEHHSWLNVGKTEETTIMTEITTLTQVNPEHLSDNKKQELILQQNKLDRFNFITEDHQDIAKHCYTFNSNLYESKYNNTAIMSRKTYVMSI